MSGAGAPEDEFRFLRGDAARVGRVAPLPAVERVSAAGTGGRRVSGLRFGAPEPPAPVALHGAGLNAHSFDPLLLALGAPALSLDLPGHGRSDWRPDADYRPDHLADDLAPALAALVRAPALLLGHSLGALAAALVAAAKPELVRHLVLVDLTPGVSPRGGARAVAEFITGRRDYAHVDEIVDRAIAFGIGSDRAALTRGVSLNTRRRADGRLEWTHHFAHLDGLPGGDADDPRPYAPIWATLRSLEIPVTLLRAESGLVDDRLAAEWHAQLPGSAVVDLPGPHNLHEAAPVELAAAVRPLLAG